MRIIGISGKLGSGKDTLADLINTHVNGIYNRKSFAFKLKKIGAYLTGTDEQLWFTQEGKNQYLPEWEMTIGEFQQKIGTEGMRNGVHTNGWVIALFADLQQNSHWLITDVRFTNEADAIKEKGGYLVRIEGDPAKVRANSKRDLKHSSETALDTYRHFDYFIENNGTLDDLKQHAQTILLNYDSKIKLLEHDEFDII